MIAWLWARGFFCTNKLRSSCHATLTKNSDVFACGSSAGRWNQVKKKRFVRRANGIKANSMTFSCGFPSGRVRLVDNAHFREISGSGRRAQQYSGHCQKKTASAGRVGRIASRHAKTQPFSIFQDEPRGYPPRGDDVCAFPVLASQRRGCSA